MEPFLLISSPSLHDDNFRRSVVYVWSHDESGATGVVITQPSSQLVAYYLPEWEGALVDPPVVFVGGPVEPETAVALAPDHVSGSPVGGGVSLVDLSLPVPSLAIGRVRVFSGYSGWSPGQLERELAQGAWLVAPALECDLFSSEPDTLWERVVGRIHGAPPFLKTMAAEPTSN